MKITEHVISDLMPAYHAGEASEDTRALIETYLRENPGYVWSEGTQDDPLAALNAGRPANRQEKEILMRVKRILRLRSLLFGAALFFSFMPFSVGDFSGRDTLWIMLRDQPLLAAFFGVLAVIAWLAYAWTYRVLPDAP